MGGRLVTAAPGATLSGFNLIPGTAPGSPANGDVWATSSGFFVEINGASYNLISGSSVCPLCAFTNVANVFSASPQTVQGATTTSPGWYAQITGDTMPRVRVGLNATDIASIAFGPGNANRDAFIERVGAGALRFGAPDVAAPVAQILGVQNVVAGTSNTAGAALTIAGSRGTGTGVGGSIIFQTAPLGGAGSTQNPLVNALTIFGSGGLGTGAATDQGAGALNLAGALYNNGTAPTGTGAYVRATSPALVTPSLGVATATSINGLGITTSTGILTVANGKTLTVNNSLAFSGTDSTVMTFPGTSDTVVTLSASQTLANKTLTSPVIASIVNTGTLTLPTATDTLVARGTTDTLTNKTITSSTDVLGGVTMTLGSDATGDIYYRSGGVLTRLPIGSNGNVLQVNTGLPSWQAGSSAGSITAGSTGVASCSTLQLLFNNAGTLGCENLASILTAGSGIAITGTTSPTISLSLTNATVQQSPANPTGTTSATGVMMGLGKDQAGAGAHPCAITPVYSGRVKVEFYGRATSSVAGDVIITIQFGIGTAPSNGAAITGTQVATQVAGPIAFSNHPALIANGGIVTGLSPGTAYWFDLVEATNTGATTSITSASCNIMEF